MDAVHPRILPLDAQRANVTDIVQGHDDRFEVDHAPAQAAEIPVSAGIAEAGVAAEHAHRAVALAPPHVLHVHVVDAGGEPPQEGHIVHSLIGEVAGVEVEAEPAVPAYCRDGPLGAGKIEGDLGGMHFQREVDADFVEPVQDRRPARREVSKPSVPVGLGGGREGIHRMPYRRSGESSHGLYPEPCSGAGGVLHLPGGTPADPFWVAIAPDMLWQNGLVALVDQVADRLADQMVGDGEALQASRFKQPVFVAAVGSGRQRRLHIEMVAPAGQFQALIAHLLRQRRQFGQRQIGPLAGEKSDGSWHGAPLDPEGWLKT